MWARVGAACPARGSVSLSEDMCGSLDMCGGERAFRLWDAKSKWASGAHVAGVLRCAVRVRWPLGLGSRPCVRVSCVEVARVEELGLLGCAHMARWDASW